MKALKKIIVVLPVLLVTGWSPFMYRVLHGGGTRTVLMAVAVLLFILWVTIGVIRRRQLSFFDILVQASYYVYVFSVLSLTGYFVFFNHVSSHGWWHTMAHRVATNDRVSFEPFLFLKARHVFTYDVVGNFMMLLPLGIYMPLLYKKLQHFVAVVFVAMIVSVAIELMQLATNSRITDVNDVILNTAGAALGFMVYYIVKTIVTKTSNITPRPLSA